MGGLPMLEKDVDRAYRVEPGWEGNKPPLAANEENVKLAISLTEATKQSKPAEHPADDDTDSQATDATDPFVVVAVEKKKKKKKRTVNGMPAKPEPGRDSMDVDDLAKVNPKATKGKKKHGGVAQQQQEET